MIGKLPPRSLDLAFRAYFAPRGKTSRGRDGGDAASAPKGAAANAPMSSAAESGWWRALTGTIPAVNHFCRIFGRRFFPSLRRCFRFPDLILSDRAFDLRPSGQVRLMLSPQNSSDVWWRI